MINQINSSNVTVFLVDTRVCSSEQNLQLIKTQLAFRVLQTAHNKVPLIFAAWGEGAPVKTFNNDFSLNNAFELLSTKMDKKGGNIQSMRNFNGVLSQLPVDHHVKIHVIATKGFSLGIITEQPKLAHLKFTIEHLYVEGSNISHIPAATIDSLADRHPNAPLPFPKRQKMTTE